MNRASALAVIPQPQDSSRPDALWIKKNVSVLEVGEALGLRIRNCLSKCWRPENHTNGDADPSLHFYARKNRVRCFVCDMNGGHSCIDLVMGVRGLDFAAAVEWIAKCFPVQNVKPGHPVGCRTAETPPYRVGVQGSDLEVLVRSGMFGQLSAAARSILVVLSNLRDPDSGLSCLSYAALMRYAGIGSNASVAQALKRLARVHAIEIHRGFWVGGIRKCSSYRVTLDDPKFLEACNRLYTATRDQISAERAYRKSLRRKRERERAGRVPLPVLTSLYQPKTNTSTCEGLNLSSPSEVMSNKPLHAVKRVISIPGLDPTLTGARDCDETQMDDWLARHGLSSPVEGLPKTRFSNQAQVFDSAEAESDGNAVLESLVCGTPGGANR